MYLKKCNLPSDLIKIVIIVVLALLSSVAVQLKTPNRPCCDGYKVTF